MRQRALWLSSLGLGVAAVFLLDPVSGRRRRHHVRDLAVHATHRIRHSAAAVMHHLRNRTYGVITVARRRFGREQSDDGVLEERVHSALGRVVAHPHAITVKVHDGCVILDGPIPTDQKSRIVYAVRSIRGVKDVEARFNPHIQPAHERSTDGRVRFTAVFSDASRLH
jgi:osmotically-inducible protein OsmY